MNYTTKGRIRLVPKGVYPRAVDALHIREMTEVEAAWIGAAIDTDGWVTFSRGNERNKERGYKYWQIGFGSTEVELISAFLRATGTGRVCLAQPSATAYPNAKPFWRWLIWSKVLTAQLAARVAPYSMKVRKINDDLATRAL